MFVYLLEVDECTRFRVHNCHSCLSWLRITRRPAVTGIADRTGCQWPSKSFKIDNFHVI